MLPKKKLAELRERLESAQHPVFYYDNDADGLCSFLLLRRWLGRGEGIAVRSYPELDERYAQKAVEKGADVAVVLDKPVVAFAFFHALERAGIAVVWIDHHVVQYDSQALPSSVSVYTSVSGRYEKKGGEPVSAIAFVVCARKEDAWIALMGCIADHYLPMFAKEFAKRYPEYWKKNVRKPFDAYYGTEIGAIARSLNFGLKDSAKNVERLQQHLLHCQSPADVLAETKENEHFREIVMALQRHADELLEKAGRAREGRVIFFAYGGATSMSAELANALVYHYPQCRIAVVYVKGAVANISMRGKGVRGVLERLLHKFEHASGGGHEEAVGARIQSKDVERFGEQWKQEVQNEA